MTTTKATDNKYEKVDAFGEVPLARFGHTIT